MKKLGICLCYQHPNYGSLLQSYATTVELKKRGINFEIIRYKKKKTPLLLIKSLPRLLNPVFISDTVMVIYQKKLMTMLIPQLKKDNQVRNECLAKFSQERFTNLSPVFYGYENLQQGSENYYGVMVGSDQLWAPGGITSNFYNLMFAKENVKRLSYSASFGVAQIKDNLKDKYTTFLSKMDYISVRENSGKKIVEKLTNKKATVVVDPVMLLTKDEWLKEIPNKRLYDEPYIFAYFLGKSPEYRKKVTLFAKEKGLKIVTSHHMDTYNKSDVPFGDYAPYNVGPEEFVNLIRNAQYVFTDSFHGSVFSMLYEKQFMVFNRYANNTVSSKNSRIDSFCENYGLSERRFCGDINAIDNKIDYKTVMEKVENHRKISLSFLDKALEDFID